MPSKLLTHVKDRIPQFIDAFRMCSLLFMMLLAGYIIGIEKSNDGSWAITEMFLVLNGAAIISAVIMLTLKVLDSKKEMIP